MASPVSPVSFSISTTYNTPLAPHNLHAGRRMLIPLRPISRLPARPEHSIAPTATRPAELTTEHWCASPAAAPALSAPAAVRQYAGSGGTRRGRLRTRTQPRQLGIPRSAVHGGRGWRPAGSVVRCNVARCDRPAMQMSRSRRANPPRGEGGGWGVGGDCASAEQLVQLLLGLELAQLVPAERGGASGGEARRCPRPTGRGRRAQEALRGRGRREGEGESEGWRWKGRWVVYGCVWVWVWCCGCGGGWMGGWVGVTRRGAMRAWMALGPVR